MDPFTGLGSTAVACARLGVSFIGSDLDETYLDAAVERVLALGRPRMAKATTTPSSSRRSAQAAV
jgi:site-specific DNA-methyltransferase (adenine-specific)